MNNSERFELVLSSLPYSGQIKNINFDKKNEVTFDWRGTTYKVSDNGHVTEIDGGMAVRSSAAIIFEALLSKTKRLKAL